ncbi:MAG TPA: hypothetical protein PKA63_06110 [Oligoflexia bacterium]|nr:hypothetical protein [Oligoflexia bacterium]HMP48224.1 hypothetical protein [Oligoflexia bacterium]
MEHNSIEKFAIPNETLKKLISDFFPVKDSGVSAFGVDSIESESRTIDLSLSGDLNLSGFEPSSGLSDSEGEAVSVESASDFEAKAVSPLTKSSWARLRSSRNVDEGFGWATANTLGGIDFGDGTPDWDLAKDEISTSTEVNAENLEDFDSKGFEDQSPVIMLGTEIDKSTYVPELLQESIRIQQDLVSRIDLINQKLGMINTDQIRIDIADLSEESYVRSNSLQKMIVSTERKILAKIALIVILAGLGGLTGGIALSISLLRQTW